MTDREFLEALFRLLYGRHYVTADEIAIRKMVKEYQQPPLTLYSRVAMQLTANDYKALIELLVKIEAHLRPESDADELVRDTANGGAGDLPYNSDASQ